ncbi:hypothetical protein [Streptomyces spinosirectus]
MPDHPPTPYDVTLCVENLRAGLVALGNCNTATAQALATALRGTAAGR